MSEADAPKFNSRELISFTWQAADRLRGYIQPWDYKNYLLPLLILKRISDTWDLEHSAAVSGHGEDVSSEVESTYHRYTVPDGCHWANLIVSIDPWDTLRNIIPRLVAANPERLSGIFEEISRADSTQLPKSVINDLIRSLDPLRLDTISAPDDVFGASVDHVIRQLIETSGPGAGAYVTPQGVVRLLTRIVDPHPGEKVYDPACGTGGMLIGAINELRELRRDTSTLMVYGQEIIPTMAAMARMNLILHGVDNSEIACGDTLRAPGFLEGSQLKTFDVIVANPPFSVNHWGADTWIDQSYGRAFCGIPPAARADLAWVQHMITSMNRSNGRVAVILPNGALFRSGTEKIIRKCLIEQDFLEAVIGLPPNPLYSASIQTCAVIFRASKRHERKEAVLFIDASTRTSKGHKRDQVDRNDIELIVTTYQSGVSEQLPARLVNQTEIARNDWNLEVTRYLGSDATEQEPANPITATEHAPIPRLATKELRELCSVTSGKNRVAKDGDEDKEFRVIRAEDIRSSLTPWADLPQSNHRKPSSVAVSPGDIIGSRSGPFGRWIVVPEGYGPALASDHTITLKAHGEVSMWYLLGFLKSPQGKELIKSTTNGAIISRISPTELERIHVPCPPLEPEYLDSTMKGFEEEHNRLERSLQELYIRFSNVYDSTNPVESAARLDALQGITASIRGMIDLGEIYRIARTSYPYPIARTLRTAGNALDVHEKYQEIVHELPETLSVLLASICASVARERAIRGGKKYRQWANATARIGATIGNRHSMVLEVAGSLISSDSSDDIGGLARALGDENAPAVILIRKLLNERNRIHGDYPRTEFQFGQRLEGLESDVRQLLEALGFLARWEFRYAELVEPLEDEDHSTFFSATFRVLRGDNQDWELVSYSSESPLYRGRLYALVDDQYLIDLYPFLLVQPCQVCGRQEVYHPSTFNDSETHLKSIDQGHTKETSDARLISDIKKAFT